MTILGAVIGWVLVSMVGTGLICVMLKAEVSGDEREDDHD